MANNSGYRYDHPQYLVHDFVGGGVGNAGAVRFAAYTDMMVKSITIKQLVVGTTASQVFSAYKVTATATTTITLTTIGTSSAAYYNTTTNVTLALGDVFSVVNAGADALATYGVGVELAYIPGGSFAS